jgi:hypothetical protein
VRLHLEVQPPTKNDSSSPSGGCTRTVPGLSVVSNGAWRGAMPTSPITAGANTIMASPLWMWPSALTMSTCSFTSLSTHPSYPHYFPSAS